MILTGAEKIMEGGYININTSNTFITGSLPYDWFGSPRNTSVVPWCNG